MAKQTAVQLILRYRRYSYVVACRSAWLVGEEALATTRVVRPGARCRRPATVD